MNKFFYALLVLFPFFSLLAQAEIKVALILDKGGKDDKSFNSAAYAGALEAKKKLEFQLKTVETTDDAAIESTIRSFAAKGFDLIIGIGFSMTESIQKVATQFPQVKFALVDGEAKAANVRSLLFEEHQGSFLVGAIAALTSKTEKIGFLGGMDVPLIRRFQMGFEAGAKHVNPKINVVTSYVGVTSQAWNNPAKAKELALAMYEKNADIIFGAAGASNYGLFNAAEEKKKFAIGVDSNQNWIKPGTILTSMLKRVDLAVMDTISAVASGKFEGGIHRFGLKDKGVDYSFDSFNEKLLPASVRQKVEVIKAGILSSKIAVPDYYLKNGK